MVDRRTWSRIATVKDVGGEAPAAIKSAARAFRVIEFFDEIRRAARANEISERLEIPQSSVSFLLNSMVRLGYLDYDLENRTYLPSLRVAMLGAWLDTGHFRDGRILDMLERLSEETGMAIGLSTRSGIHARYLHAIQAKTGKSLHITLATRRYAVWSSAGVALITELSQAELSALIRRTRAEKDPFVERIDPRKVAEFVEDARRDGYFFSRGLVTAIAGSLSMRLPRSLTGDWQDVALSINGDLAPMVEREGELIQLMRSSIARVESSAD